MAVGPARTQTSCSWMGSSERVTTLAGAYRAGIYFSKSPTMPGQINSA